MAHIPNNLQVYMRFPVLDHGRAVKTETKILGVPAGDGWDLWKIDCTECGGAAAPTTENTAAGFVKRAEDHAKRCQDKYRPRAKKCHDADRRGDDFVCPRCR
ncbi:hypothetical protein ACXZ65_34340 [Streptomyces aculeolatus]